MTALPGQIGDKKSIGAMPLPGPVTSAALNGLGYDSLDSATVNPPVAFKNEDELGCLSGALDPGGAGTATSSTSGRRMYRFVINSGTTTAALASGDLCYAVDSTYGKVTTHLQDAASGNATTTTGRNLVAGVASGTITIGNKGWVQIEGTTFLNTTGATIAVGDVLVASTTDKQATNIAAGSNITFLPVAVAFATDASSRAKCRLVLIPR